MGVWGTGLYAGDFAMDLRGTIGGVLRLPLADADLLTAICSVEPEAANDSDNSDYTDFWLVVADQFAKRGIDLPEARAKAIAIIDSDADIAAKKALGLDEKSAAVRRKMLGQLRDRILQPPIQAKPRKTLSKPQPLVCETGDIYAYATSQGSPSNPYFENPEAVDFLNWKMDGWGAMVVVECGHFLGYLAWYRALTPASGWNDVPSLEQVLQKQRWFINPPGTLRPLHAKRMRMTKVGQISIDPAKLDRAFPARTSPRSAAISDITIANRMTVVDLSAFDERRIAAGRPLEPRIESLRDIMA